MIPITLEKKPTYSDADYFGHVNGDNIEIQPSTIVHLLQQVYAMKIDEFTNPDSTIDLEKKVGDFSAFELTPLQSDEELAIAYNDKAAAELHHARLAINNGAPDLSNSEIEENLKDALKFSSNLSNEQISSVHLNLAYLSLLRGDTKQVRQDIQNSYLFNPNPSYVSMLMGDAILKDFSDYIAEINKNPEMMNTKNKEATIGRKNAIKDVVANYYTQVVESYLNNHNRSTADYVLAYTAATRLELLTLPSATLSTDILATAQAETGLNNLQANNLKDIVNKENKRYEPFMLAA